MKTSPYCLSTGFAIGACGFIQFAHDVGRLDYVNYVILVVALLATVRRKVWIASCLAAASILVHEAFAIYAFPLILAFYFKVLQKSEPDFRNSLWRVGLCALPGVLAAAGVFFFGNTDRVAEIPHGYGQRVWARQLVEPSFAHPLWQYLVFSYCFAVLFVLLRAFYRANSLKIDPVFLASLTPLALYLFGIDYGRWVAIEFFLLTCTVMVHVTYFGCELPRLKKTLLVAALIFCVPLGPMGSVGAFTYLPF